MGGLISAGLVLAAGIALAPKGEEDMTAALMDAIDQVRASGGGEIRLAAGTYHFRSPQAMRFYVSNHDNPLPRNVFLPVTNVTGLVLTAKPRAEFVFHGEGIGLALIDTKDTRVRGVGLDWAHPNFKEVVVDEVCADKRIVISADPKQFPLELNEKGCLIAAGEGWQREYLFELFDGKTRARKGGGFLFDGRAEAQGNNRFRPYAKMADLGCTSPLAVGDFATLRSTFRPNPAVFLYRADKTLLENFVVRAAAGMGLIAQRSADVTLRGTGKPLDKRAGAFARAGTGRRLSLQADATHFSNCRGQITVENCLFEGMNDDAINVHSTCLRIERVDSPTQILCRYMHGQSIGFEVFLPGERLRLIKAKTMEPRERLTKVVTAEMQDAWHVLLTLKDPLPEGIAVGDAVENADWQPSVTFRGNLVRNSSPRATLFTTPGKVVCENNVFEHISAQAISLPADTWDWYESGACRDVTIRNNVFRDVCILEGRGVIQIDPNVRDLPAQKARYHRNILIEGNVFEQAKGPLLYARSVSNLVWRANDVRKVPDSARTFDVKFCESVKGIPFASEGGDLAK